MRLRTLVAIAGWCGLVVSCADVLGIDASGYSENRSASASGTSGGTGGSGATGSGASGGGGATGGGGAGGCPDGAWYDATYAWCVPEWANWHVPADAPGQATYTWTADTVTDLVTGLIWQRHADTSGACGDGDCTWEEAHGYCFDLELDGFQDWRLPSIIELASLLDYSQAPPGPTIDPLAFPGEPGEFFWSASCFGKLCPEYGPAGASSALYGSFGSGHVYYDDVDYNSRVRCVR